MNIVPKVGPLIAEILSGFTALVLAYLDLFGFRCQDIPNLQGGDAFILVLVIWILGTFFDLLRNLLEHAWDWTWPWSLLERLLGNSSLRNEPLNWDFFLSAEEGKLARLDHYFWSFYLIDADMAIAILAFCFFGPMILSATFGEAHAINRNMKLVLLAIAALFSIDAWTLRREIKRLVRNGQPTS